MTKPIMNKITKEQAREWLGIVQSGLIGREYRDVFLRLPDILQSYIAREDELESCTFEPTPIELSQEVTRLESENQALKEEVEVIELEKHVLVEANQKYLAMIAKLEAENEVLTAEIDNLKRYIGEME